MKIIGIDLGTSNCCVSYIDDEGKMQIIRDTEYSTSITIPSMELFLSPNSRNAL